MNDSAESREVLNNFVVLEGIDGAGTTTQLNLLRERLNAVGIKNHCTFEPTNGKIGKLIRTILSYKEGVSPDTVALLFAADRSEHVNNPDKGIIARVNRGEIVISDRYLFSSLAYQSIQSGFNFVYSLNSKFPLPSLVFFIDTPVEECQKRLKIRGKSELFDRVDFQKKVRESYLATFDYFKKKFKEESNFVNVRVDKPEFFVLEGGRSPKTISDEIWKIITTLPIFRKC